MSWPPEESYSLFGKNAAANCRDADGLASKLGGNFNSSGD